MADYTLCIGNKNYSSWSLRGWLMCKLAGIDFDEVMVRLDEPDRTRRIMPFSPSGRVPALKTGGLTVWDSLAIGEFLAERFPERRLWPADPTARAIARAVSAEMHSGFAALRTQLPMNMHRDRPPAGYNDAAQRDIDRILDLWRDCRSRFGAGGPYLFGGLSIADAMYAPVVSRFTTYRVSLDGTAEAYCEAMWEWPALDAWRNAALAEPWVIEHDEI
ncbi:MAG: glutathione S-transferase family protein [Rhodospirillaceae bacterium]|nr:glutathione S-transferase family protein [Rhodospirillaceae bacterium]